jgi:hypothetical protein
VGDLRDLTAQVDGAFVATLQMQGRIEGAFLAGSTWGVRSRPLSGGLLLPFGDKHGKRLGKLLCTPRVSVPHLQCRAVEGDVGLEIFEPAIARPLGPFGGGALAWPLAPLPRWPAGGAGGRGPLTRPPTLPRAPSGRASKAGGHGEAAVSPAIGGALLATLIDGKAICNTR